MPSKTDFNVSPYFDDYSEDKKFHRVMYRPAFAVQARELTTQQSITQNQIEKFGDHMFKHGAMVVPGQIEPDMYYEAVKLTSFNGTLTNYNGNTLTGGTSGVVADVVNVVATDGTDPDTLIEQVTITLIQRARQGDLQITFDTTFDKSTGDYNKDWQLV